MTYDYIIEIDRHVDWYRVLSTRDIEEAFRVFRMYCESGKKVRMFTERV